MLLFLDFDGVLHPSGAQSDTFFMKVHLLERFLCDEAPDWNIVISSSWRSHHTLKDIQGLLPESLRERLVGVTPQDNDVQLVAEGGELYEKHPRQVQIQTYLERQGLSNNAWVALDDMADFFFDAPNNPNLVLCNPDVGVGPVDIEKLRQYL